MIADPQDISLSPVVDDSVQNQSQVADEIEPAKEEKDETLRQASSNDQPETPVDPRHLKRIHRMQLIFAYQASDGKSVHESPDFFEKFAEFKDEIDQQIQTAAPEWPLDQMNQVDWAILRTILLEHKVKKTPVKVLIDEAIEIAREYGTESSPKFINGVLGKILIDSN